MFLYFQIDVDVITLMSDEELKVYLPKFGDRIAISSFVKSMEVTDADKNTSPASDRKRPFVEKLMKKVKTAFLICRHVVRIDDKLPPLTKKHSILTTMIYI